MTAELPHPIFTQATLNSDNIINSRITAIDDLLEDMTHKVPIFLRKQLEIPFEVWAGWNWIRHKVVETRALEIPFKVMAE